MSTTFLKKGTTVLARAYGAKPIVANVASIQDSGAIEIIDAEGIQSLFPQRDIYEFDSSLERKLVEAFTEENRQLLLDLWDKAQPFSQGSGPTE